MSRPYMVKTAKVYASTAFCPILSSLFCLVIDVFTCIVLYLSTLSIVEFWICKLINGYGSRWSRINACRLVGVINTWKPRAGVSWKWPVWFTGWSRRRTESNGLWILVHLPTCVSLYFHLVMSCYCYYNLFTPGSRYPGLKTKFKKLQIVRPPDIVCRRTYILPVFLLSFFLSFFLFSPPNLRGRWTQLNKNRPHGRK